MVGSGAEMLPSGVQRLGADKFFFKAALGIDALPGVERLLPREAMDAARQVPVPK